MFVYSYCTVCNEPRLMMFPCFMRFEFEWAVSTQNTLYPIGNLNHATVSMMLSAFVSGVCLPFWWVLPHMHTARVHAYVCMHVHATPYACQTVNEQASTAVALRKLGNTQRRQETAQTNGLDFMLQHSICSIAQ